MTDPLTIKAGDTFSRTVTCTVDDVAIDLTGYTPTSQVRAKSDELDAEPVDELECTPDADQETNPGVLVLSATAEQTATWLGAGGRERVLLCDVRLVGTDNTRHTDSFEILVRRAITRS